MGTTLLVRENRVALASFRGMTHVRTIPYYPQSNGKIERNHRTLKSECIRTKCPLTLEQAKRRRSTKCETESLKKPQKIEQKFVQSRLPQVIIRVLDQRIGKCWETTPGGIITAPSRCRRQLQGAWRSRVSRPANATCLWPQRDKSGGLGGRAPKTHSICFFIHLSG
jgi:hypothetical protein